MKGTNYSFKGTNYYFMHTTDKKKVLMMNAELCNKPTPVRQKPCQIKILDSNTTTTREMDNRDAIKKVMISMLGAKEAHKESSDLKCGPLCFFFSKVMRAVI